MQIKKISEIKWEIPKAGAMQVPGIIFASEKLLADMQKDITIKQIQNVAKLLPSCFLILNTVLFF